MVTLGLWSFSLYLWQQPFRVMRGQLPAPFLLAAAFVCALASFYVVERPAWRFLNRYWGTAESRKGAAATAAAAQDRFPASPLPPAE
jgi:peptidoglycan/LPS O-acetylase OafA/YrhL